MKQHLNRGGHYNTKKRGRSGGNSRPICQVCGKIRHTAAHCYYQYGNSYMGAIPKSSTKVHQSLAFLFSTENNLEDPVWYADSDATNYVTGDTNILQSK